ncbi:MAG: hypothetical protein EXR72_07020 [Myxococcales bacterium]|nr:hypothetical protein [Myxococcales bacterium]
MAPRWPLLAGCVALTACAASPIPAPSAPGPFDARLLAIAAEYAAYGRVDDELRWAPFLCRQPLPGVARQSSSSDASTYGQKLFSVFAKDHAGYPATSKVGQVVVKQSWVPELVTDPNAKFDPGSVPGGMIDADHFYPYAKKDGKIYRAVQPAGLYVLYKLDPATAGTDIGWVYGTVSSDGQVTSAGRVAACMGCHEDAPHDRLFGTGP